MIITNKKELEMVAEFLTKSSEITDNYKESGAFSNVAGVLKQAIKEGDFDDTHDAYTLQVVKQPNMLDVAIEKNCTTNCYFYRKGCCPYKWEEKQDCNYIHKYIFDEYDESEG